MDIPYFYPAHDLALANGIRHFNPPAAAIQLQQDLADLPQWWCDNTSHPEELHPAPWGWNADTRQWMLKQGIAATLLPSDADLQQLRNLSSRIQTLPIIEAINKTLGHDFPSFRPIAIPRAIDKAESLLPLIEQRHEAPFLLKAPWSSSGRGLCWSDVSQPDALLKRGTSIIRDMGCVLVEPRYKKVQDFAMLFEVGNEAVTFMGYSVFETDHMGTYRNGLLMSNDNLQKHLARWVATEALDAIKMALIQEVLPHLFAPLMKTGFQVGPIGIDMMIYEQEGELPSYWIHPCIEMNVRCTMGTAARRIFDQHVEASCHGTFRIDYFKTPEALVQYKNQMQKTHPAFQQNQRYIKGFVPLCTPHDHSHFMAYLLIEA